MGRGQARYKRPKNNCNNDEGQFEDRRGKEPSGQARLHTAKPSLCMAPDEPGRYSVADPISREYFADVPGQFPPPELGIAVLNEN